MCNKRFDRKNPIQILKMPLEAVEQYYVDLREYEFLQCIPLKHMRLRKAIHRLLLQLVKLDRILSKEQLYIVSDKRIKSNRAKIYACTHIGGNDVQRTFEAITDHAYLFLGDPRGLYKDITGILLRLNGVICLETNNKKDRRFAYQRAIELLSGGTDLLIYPEGAWNITYNLPVMRLYSGTVKMAQAAKADIIPVAIAQYDSKFFVNIGENISWDILKSQSVSHCNEALRDTLASLKWEIYEYNGCFKRAEISKEFVEGYKQSIVDRCPYGFTIQDVYDTMCKY